MPIETIGRNDREKRTMRETEARPAEISFLGEAGHQKKNGALT
jgi:hypothetical protein